MWRTGLGDEITHRHFGAEDFSRFRRLLKQETEHLSRLFKSGEFSTRGDIVGFELEAWIVDEEGLPRNFNRRLLDTLNNPLVVPELSQFNVELNGSPTALTGSVFTRLHDELLSTWNACQRAAQSLGVKLIQIGTLPTVKQNQLTSKYMSDMVRYQALNDRLMALRDGDELDINISGTEDLNIKHDDVMLEAGTTSFQIHLQCKPHRATRDFNAALVASAPMVALSANSRFLFGKGLWAETRVPLFEQAIDIGSRHLSRVTFGRAYVAENLMEIFEANLNDHAILLPFVQPEPLNKYAHVRFQNGTIWRWNRPLIGFDYDGQPHLRIEHRGVPSGPTVLDCVANCAAFVGFVRGLASRTKPIESELTFETAKSNFYEAAKHGLNATIEWIGGTKIRVAELILKELLPEAHEGLANSNIPQHELDKFLGIIKDRVASGINGTTWQHRWTEKHGNDYSRLSQAYLEHQETNQPVHTWSI